MILFACLLVAGIVTACGGAATLVPTPVSQPVEPTRLPDVTITKAPDATEQPATRSLETPDEIVGPVVTVGEVSFPVELATTVGQQVQGLSGRASLAPGSGMLFVYDQERKFTFWMKDMRFPLDIVWIGADCAVVEVTQDIPPPVPGQADQQLPRYSPGTPAQYVLEINAGEAGLQNITPGDPVGFAGDLAGRYGC